MYKTGVCLILLVSLAARADDVVTIEELQEMPSLASNAGTPAAAYADTNHNGLWDGVERRIRLEWYGPERTRLREFMIDVAKLYQAVAVAKKPDNERLGYLEQINQLSACMLKDPSVTRDWLLDKVATVRGWVMTESAFLEEYVRIKNSRGPVGVRQGDCDSMIQYFYSSFNPYPKPPVVKLNPANGSGKTEEQKRLEREHRYSSPDDLSSF